MGDREALTETERDALMQTAIAAVQALDGNALYGRGTIRPDQFLSATYTDWKEWKRHFTVIAEANGWTDEQSRRAVPTCLTGWALDEYSVMPRQYQEQVNGQPAPSLQRLFNHLDPKTLPHRIQRTAREEFKYLCQESGKVSAHFPVQSVGGEVNANLIEQARDDMCWEQFIDGLMDSEIHELLLREDPPNFNDVVKRALSLRCYSEE